MRSPPTASCSRRARSARPTCCCATVRSLPGHRPGPGHALLRQRRPAHAGAQAARPADRQARSSSRAASGRRSRWRCVSRAASTRRRARSPGRGFYLEDAGYPDLLNWLIQVAEMPGAIAARLVHRSSASSCACCGREPTRTSVPSSRACSATPSSHRGSSRCWAWVARCRSASWACATTGSTSDWTIDRSTRLLRRTCGDAQEALAAGARRQLPGQPGMAPGAPGHHRPPAGRRAHGPRTRERASSTPGARSSGTPGCTWRTARSCPGTVGPNPSLTIAALADRFADGIC